MSLHTKTVRFIKEEGTHRQRDKKKRVYNTVVNEIHE